MFKHAHIYRYGVVPLSAALLWLFVFAPSAFAASDAHHYSAALVGPKLHYLALGNSLAFGYQPDLDFNHGYVDDFFNNLKGHGVIDVANMGCPGETSNTFINGGCPYSYLRKYPYTGSQLQAALGYLHRFAGQVSPVTLDIGANDLLPDIDRNTCVINQAKFTSALVTLDTNLKQTILPQLHAALTVKGQVTGDLVMMNYYDPYQNICPDTVPNIQELNQHLAADMSGFGIIVNVFKSFGGATVPNKHICTYTWMCSYFKDVHATNTGYSVIATTFEKGTGY